MTWDSKKEAWDEGFDEGFWIGVGAMTTLYIFISIIILFVVL